MARSLDSNIYGSDTNAMADMISSGALSSTVSLEAITEAEATAKGNSPDPGEVREKSGLDHDGRAKSKGL